MFKIAKQMRKDREDVKGTKFIRDERGDILVEQADILDRWRQYFCLLLNKENEYRIDDVEKVEGPVEKISLNEVEMALKDMKNGKAPGPTGLTSDLLKDAGKEGIRELMRILNVLEQGWGTYLLSRAA